MPALVILTRIESAAVCAEDVSILPEDILINESSLRSLAHPQLLPPLAVTLTARARNPTVFDANLPATVTHIIESYGKSASVIDVPVVVPAGISVSFLMMYTW